MIVYVDLRGKLQLFMLQFTYMETRLTHLIGTTAAVMAINIFLYCRMPYDVRIYIAKIGNFIAHKYSVSDQRY